MDLNEINNIENSNKKYYSEFNIFKQDLKSILSLEQEKELFLRLANGDDQVKTEIFERNLKLVISIAKKYVNVLESLNLEDLVQEGSIGLMIAIEKFDINKGYKFSTYATWWIKQSILRAINDKNSFIRLPVYLCDKLQKYRNGIKFLTQKLKRKPTKDEVTEFLELTPNEINEILIFQNEVTSLDVPISETNEETTLQDFVLSHENVEADIIDCSRKEYMYKLLNEVLRPREKNILLLRYGLYDGKEWTLEEIGKIYKLTRERIRQIESKALKKIKNSKQFKLIKDYENTEEISHNVLIKAINFFNN